MSLLGQVLQTSPEELEHRAGERLLVLPDPSALYHHFAESIAAEIETNNHAGRPTRLILPLGPRGQFPILARICNERRISWERTHVFFMDEYLDWQGRPIPVEHPLSFEGFARQNFFSLLDEPLRLPESQLRFPHPLKLDELAAEIDAAGGIDSCYGGIGIHGHIAFNEPPTVGLWRVSAEEFRNSMPRVVFLNPETVTMGAARWTGGDVGSFPSMAVTLGMKQLLSARRMRLYCDGGSWQRAALRAALLAEPSVEYPVSLARDHRDLLIIADRATVGYGDAGKAGGGSSAAL